MRNHNLLWECKKEILETWKFRKKELNVLDSLQESIMTIMSKKKKDLKLLPPTPKLQAWNEIQNVLFKNCMAIMQNSLHRKLNSTAIVDDSFSPSKTRKTQSLNNFGNNFQANILGKF